VACREEMRNTYKDSVGRLEEMRPFRRLRCRWEYIKMNLEIFLFE
jgi:hypothetical protein